MIRTTTFIFALFLSFAAMAEMRLDSPDELLQRAAQGKHQLRDVINDLDQQLSEMRDVRTFNRYFFLLDDLDRLATDLGLGSIYPDAVKKLGSRMVQKGVNWLDVVETPKEEILYYHKWMEPPAAFSFLYAAELRVKEEKSLQGLKAAAENLEDSLLFADKKWTSERSLRLVYRETLSQVAVRALARTDLNDDEIVYWIGKIYSAEAMGEIVTSLQGQLYQSYANDKADLHIILRKLVAIHRQLSSDAFGAPEGLSNQVGDAAVDLILKSLVFEERLSDDEFQQILSVLRPRHLASLGSTWASLGKTPKKEFAGYYIRRAFYFIQVLEKAGLKTEAQSLSTVITARAASVLGREQNIEGSWLMKDSKGQKWRLVVAFASEDVVIASMSDLRDLTRRAYSKVIYDMHQGGYIAMDRENDLGSDPNLPLRFVPQEDGTIEVEDLLRAPGEIMEAKREQVFPDLLQDAVEPSDDSEGTDVNGLYKGVITLPSGDKRKVTLLVTMINGGAVGNLRFLDKNDKPTSNLTFNFGTEGKNGVLYLTRGHGSSGSSAGGTWMQLRTRVEKDGSLKGFAVYGWYGIVKTEFVLKKVGAK
ncbi:MAG: hypothetical protein KF789_02920 [Bdellovibrionaceae bacterium]|nr:hypothetical protein [Pseudobdellovibrionaceae bacterium]